MFALLIGTTMLFVSCNKHSTSENVRSEIESIDWRLDDAMQVHHHGSGGSGGSAASRSTYSFVADLVAPEGFILPEDSVERLIGKLSTAIERAGGKVLEAREDNGINYTRHSKNFDQSAYIYKVVYEADGAIGYIGGVLIKRRYFDESDEGLETIGQILLSLHEQR